MALTLAPLLALPIAGLLIRRAGHPLDAWVLPTAIGFHWLLLRGHGTDRVYLFAVALFVTVVAAIALRSFIASRAKARSQARPPGRPQRASATDTRPTRPTPIKVRTIQLPRRPTMVASAPPIRPEIELAQPAAATAAIIAERMVLPPSDAVDLLDRIEAAASAEQREDLIEQLRGHAEVIDHVRARAGHPNAVLGKARTISAHAWGDGRCDGFLARFDGVARRDSTILVVLCDVTDDAGLLDEAARDAARGSALIVPADLAGVKRLRDIGENEARWLARAVFVPLHLLVGDLRSSGRGPGDGETVTGRPA